MGKRKRSATDLVFSTSPAAKRPRTNDDILSPSAGKLDARSQPRTWSRPRLRAAETLTFVVTRVIWSEELQRQRDAHKTKNGGSPAPVTRPTRPHRGGPHIVAQVRGYELDPHDCRPYRVSGSLPATAPYYQYTYEVRKSTDKYGAVVYLNKLRASSLIAGGLTKDLLGWILAHELHFQPTVVRAHLRRVRNPDARGEALLGALPRSLRNAIVAQSPYFAAQPSLVLARWFPHVEATTLNTQVSALAPEDREALMTTVRECPWRLAFGALSKRFRAVGAPIPETHLLQVFGPQERDRADKVPPLPCADAATLREAVLLYTYLRQRMKREGHTAFRPWYVPRYWKAMPEVLRFLIADAQLVVSRTVSLCRVYHLKQQWSVRQQLLDALTQIHRTGRRRTAGSEDFAFSAHLTPEQRAAANHVRRNPLTFLTGGPGCGKTAVIEELLRLYPGSEGTAVCSLTGSMAAALQKRGIAGACTLHAVLEALVRGPERTGEPPSDEWEAIRETTRLLIIDEASNNDEKLLARILSVFPNLERLLLVLDGDQIGPISPGQPACDLLRALPEYVCRLTVNHRVLQEPATRSIVTNDDALLRRKFATLRFRALRAGGPDPGPEARAGCVTVAPSGKGLEFDLQWIRTHLCVDEHEEQGIVLTNVLRKNANRDTEHARGTTRFRFYRGQRLTTVAKNHHKRRVEEVTSTRKGAPRHTDAVRNGEQFVFRGWRDFNVAEQRWVGPEHAQLLKNEARAGATAQHLRFFFMQCGRCIACSAKYVPLAHIISAWFITVDKAQGREARDVIMVLPDLKRGERFPSSFGRNHAHVAISRARRLFVLYGSVATLEQLARNPAAQRQTLLESDVRERAKQWAEEAPVPVGFLRAAEKGRRAKTLEEEVAELF